MVEDMNVKASGVQIDAAVKCVLCVVGTHVMASLAMGRPDPASWLPGFGTGCAIHAWDRGNP
jgi:hypothetical protein